MSDGESRQVIQQLLLANCENVDSSLKAVSLASHASPRTPVGLRPGECIDFFFNPNGICLCRESPKDPAQRGFAEIERQPPAT